MAANNLSLDLLHQLLQYSPETGVFHWRGKPNHRVQRADVAGCVSSAGYRVIRIQGRQWKAHRLAWQMVHGSAPAGDLDHINGDRLDNRICNLREASDLANAQNRRRACKNSRSGLLGVVTPTVGSSYNAAIRVDGRKVHLGSFKTKEEAHAAYVMAKRVGHPAGTL